MQKLINRKGADIYVDLREVKAIQDVSFFQVQPHPQPKKLIHQALIDMGSESNYYVKLDPPGSGGIGFAEGGKTGTYCELLKLIENAKA